MSSHLFTVQGHTLPCQHIREYARATANEQEDVLHVKIKHYRPLNNLNPEPGDVTIIGAHANGFPKELYEPLWDEILHRSSRNNFRIRGIWIADVSNQGASGVVNELVQGNDPSWFDHSRDLLHMINHFRDQMPRPIVGVGHSMGAVALAHLSILHPRLLSTLVLLEPVLFEKANPTKPVAARASAHRRELWPSREEAQSSFRKSKFYQQWDQRVLDQWLRYGLRELPTALLSNRSTPSQGAVPVTLTTPKAQEVWTFLRPVPKGSTTGGRLIVDRETHADLDGSAALAFQGYRPECVITFNNLPHIRPSVLFVFGGRSRISPARLRERLLETTGTGLGGSGGRKEGRVDGLVLLEKDHLIAMDAVEPCADAAAAWLGKELERTREQDARLRAQWSSKPLRDKATLSEEFKQQLGGDPRPPAKGKARL